MEWQEIECDWTLAEKTVCFLSFMAENDVKCLNQSDRLTSFLDMKCEDLNKIFRQKFHCIPHFLELDSVHAEQYYVDLFIYNR